MTITVNDEPQDVSQDLTLESLLQELSADPAQTASLVNEVLVRPTERAACVLQEQDRIELLTFAGGG